MKEIIKVGYATYEMRHMSDEVAAASEAKGHTYIEQELIEIEKGHSPKFTAQIQIHEILHTLFDMWGIQIAPDKEEAVCEGLAYGLATVLGDNPKFFIKTIATLADMDVSAKQLTDFVGKRRK